MNRFLNHHLLFLCIGAALLLVACKNQVSNDESKPDELPQIVKDTTSAAAVALSPSKESIPIPDYDTTQWVDLLFMDSSIIIDLKYAGEDNFVKEKMYECARCFLRPQAAKVVLKIHRDLQEKGMGLKLFDCYRPLSIQQKLWDKVPDATYVTNPKKGSMHNRGLAVDLTIVDRNGQELDMGTPFDFFGRKAHHTHMDHPREVLENRRLLKSTMEAVGFKSIRTEWWHYSYRSAKYPLADMVWSCD